MGVNRMTDDDLKAIRTRCSAATPGPWEIGEDAQEAAATLRVQPIFASTGQLHGDPATSGSSSASDRSWPHSRPAAPCSETRTGCCATTTVIARRLPMTSACPRLPSLWRP